MGLVDNCHHSNQPSPTNHADEANANIHVESAGQEQRRNSGMGPRVSLGLRHLPRETPGVRGN
jgi:hypothetical protein